MGFIKVHVTKTKQLIGCKRVVKRPNGRHVLSGYFHVIHVDEWYFGILCKSLDIVYDTTHMPIRNCLVSNKIAFKIIRPVSTKFDPNLSKNQIHDNLQPNSFAI